MIVLGLHGGVTLGQHEPSAAIAIDGKIIASCEEERYLRIKSAYGYLPLYSIKACLEIAKIKWEDINLIITPGVTYNDFDNRIFNYLKHLFGSCPKIERIHHQLAHLSAAFFGSGYNKSLVLSLDATGDSSCGMIGIGDQENGIKVLNTFPTNKSLGFFYTMMTYYLGFTDGDEYKVMGLAPYGKPNIDLSKILKSTDEDWNFDWSFIKNNPPLRSPFEPVYSEKIFEVLKQPNRLANEKISQYHKDVASSTQKTFEETLLNLVNVIKSKNKDIENFSYAGGVALNCAANKKLYDSGLFKNIYISPVSSDRGLAIGCAYHGSFISGSKPWQLSSVYQGSSYSNDDIKNELESNSIKYSEYSNPSEKAAELISQGKIIGWFQGRSEAGARALGNRSILADCSDPSMQNKVNAKIKFREKFRPFAPSALKEKSMDYFETNNLNLPSMSATVKVNDHGKKKFPSIVHLDDTARIQTVKSSDNELYYDLIRNFDKHTDKPVIMNTSFNLKGQPIVETPRDALMTFFGCGLDSLFISNFLINKK